MAEAWSSCAWRTTRKPRLAPSRAGCKSALFDGRLTRVLRSQLVLEEFAVDGSAGRCDWRRDGLSTAATLGVAVVVLQLLSQHPRSPALTTSRTPLARQ